MNLLLQLLGNLVEAKRPCALQEDDLIVQSGEDITGEEMAHIGEERLLCHLDPVGLGRQLGTDTDKPFHTTLDSQFAHLSIQSLRTGTRLIDITQYQRLALRMTTIRHRLLTATLHEVEGDVQ